jgi:hypothetical protein
MTVPRKSIDGTIFRTLGFILMLQLYQSCTKSHSNHVTLRCQELLSSCGECEEECKIIQITGDSAVNLNLEGKMLQYEFKSPKMKEEFDRDSPFCLICCTYIFEGELFTTKESFKMEVAKFEILVDSSCCDVRFP